jgi:rubrerythrin
MSRIFDVKELVRVAVIDERSGQAMYSKMSDKAEDENLRKLFTRLVAEERGHLVTHAGAEKELRKKGG